MVGALRATGLEFAYPGDASGPVRALAGIDLSVADGELLAVIGPNGSGKSTLLRCLGGLLTPQVGRVELRGRPLGQLAERERALEIAMVPQYLPALPDVFVTDFVLGGRYAHMGRWSGPAASDLRAVELALEAADVADLSARMMTELSGGQRQRVLVARALAQEARIWLVDEPTASLDPEHQIHVFGLISRTVQHDRAAVVVTHDLNLASQFATRLALVDGGRLVAEGSVDEVLRREVLEPVYGSALHFGTRRHVDGSMRPFVLPWAGGQSEERSESK